MMKSQSPSNRALTKQQQTVDSDLMGTIGVHVNQSAKIIFNIKQSLYQLVKLNVMASAPVKKYETNSAILAGSKKNLDDLRRVQSMLKGYLHTIKIQSSQNSQEDLKRNITQSSLLPKTHQLHESPDDQGNKNRSKNLITGVNISEKMLQKQDWANGNEKQLQIYVQLEFLKSQNQRLKKQIQFTKQKEQRKVYDSTKQQNKKRQQLNKNNQKLSLKELNSQKMFQQKLSTLSQNKINPSELKLNFQTCDDIQLKQGNIEQNDNKKKLQNCKSAVFQTSRNLIQIRNRNKQCLQLIRTIKKQIGLQFKDQISQIITS